MVCINCGRFSDVPLCPVCTKTLKEESFAYRYVQRCPTCGRPQLDRAYPCSFCLDGLQAYASYSGIVRTLLRLFKVGEQRILATVFAPLYLTMLATVEKPLLIPVPSSRKGLKQRGFDQMLLISRLLKTRAGCPCLNLFSQKGEDQSKFLSLSERKQRHSLFLRQLDKKVKTYEEGGYTFVLLDDICTTGATLATCKALLSERYGIEAISLVIALV